jgi:pimeloyl-ACP methyl ester carboxylesterase
MPRSTPKPNQRTPQPSSRTEDVDPRWIVKALAVVIVAAIFCGYLTLCAFFYYGQWQLVLHPTRTTSSQPPVSGITAELVHFAPDDSAVPQLTGWWIPAAPASRYATTTILYLRGANGSLADSSPSLTALHNLGINIFAFDYRGYGSSAATHPTQLNMTQDTDSAWQYLTTSRSLPPQQIIPYGVGVGTSLAAHLTSSHPVISALILEDPQSDLLEKALHDPRTNLLPARLLYHERFPLAAPLAQLHTPKLLLSTSTPSPAFSTASAPKLTAEFPPTPPLYTQPQYLQTLTRFLDLYLPQASAPQLTSTPPTSPQSTH